LNANKDVGLIHLMLCLQSISKIGILKASAIFIIFSIFFTIHLCSAKDDSMKELENLEKCTNQNGMADASSKILSTFFTEKLNLLRDTIKDLKTEVEIRKSMGAQFDEEIEDELTFFESSLRDLLPLGKSGGMSIDKKRIHVEKRIIALKEYRRTHKEKLWHNCVWLKREIFELLQEYKELLKTQEMIA
jgi:hypothetical protein